MAVCNNARLCDAGHELSLSNVFQLLQGKKCCLLVTLLALMVCSSSLLAVEVKRSSSSLTIVNRSVSQDQGAWVVDYRLRYTGKTGVVITPEDLAIRADGWVSNSRVLSHGLPRWSSLVISHKLDLSTVSDVITTAEETERCRERLKVAVEPEYDRSPIFTRHTVPNAQGEQNLKTEPAMPPAFSLGPDAILRVRLRFEHDHILYGEYDPLLSMRSVTLGIGSAMVNDLIPLDREQYKAQPRFNWSEPPEERRDTRYAVSGPDSLHLEAHVPGHQSYRFIERPVRYGTKMRLRFWYLIAAGTEGDCKIRLAQCKETPVTWRMLHSGQFEKCLKTVGRWTKVERVIQIEAEATKVNLEFTIVGDSEVGEMWIDDVSLEPISPDGTEGP